MDRKEVLEKLIKANVNERIRLERIVNAPDIPFDMMAEEKRHIIELKKKCDSYIRELKAINKGAIVKCNFKNGAYHVETK